ncbi:MAG: phosphate acetyltransferase, partial [Campylobacter sp.]|nr:phosphate acetyltransferase [Campylobacter sp.]
MKGIFILPSAKNSVFGENFVVFEPIGNSQNSCLSFDETLKILSQNKKNELLKKIINEFEKFKNSLSNEKYFAVLGMQKNDILNTNSLNLQIAKNLNLPIIGEFNDEISLNIAKIQMKNQKICNIGNVLNGEFIAENGDKFDIKADFNKIENLINSANSQILTPLAFENMLYKRASANLKSVVLPESDDERILKAAHIINESKAVKIVLLGDENEINSKAKNLGLNLDGIRIINPAHNEYLDEFANTLYELRKAKGMELEKAKALVKDRTYFGTMLVYSGLADAMVSGASTTTAETIRPALQTIKMKPGVSTVSGS